MPRFIHLRETASTNTYLLRMAAMLPSGTVIYTLNQTAGRGQKGNSWESEPGKNLAFSMLIKRPTLQAREQFYLSEAAALAVVDTLSIYTEGLAVKWPNDVYWNNSKIAGILIENSLDGSEIAHSVIGIGVNINQERFMSDAPNPISLAQITDRQYDLDTLLHDVCGRIESMTDFSSDTETRKAKLHERYLQHLYRNDGSTHRWQLPDGIQIDAAIDGVLPDGTLCLRHTDGTVKGYAFKEIKHIVPNVSIAL